MASCSCVPYFVAARCAWSCATTAAPSPIAAPTRLVATALVALAPPASTFRRGRDFAAWLGLTPSYLDLVRRRKQVQFPAGRHGALTR